MVIDPQLTGLSIAYKLRDMVADMIAPYRPVQAELFEVDELDYLHFFELHDDSVGRLGVPNQVHWNSTRKQYSVEDHGLDAPIPNRDMQNYQGVGPSPRALMTESINHFLALNREVAVANLVQDPANYKPNLQQVLSGTSQWSDYAASDPIDTILAAKNVPLIMPNALVLSTWGWRVIRQHPRIIEAIRGTGAGIGAIGVGMREAVRELLELDYLIIGQARAVATPRNISAPAQTPPRIWGKHAALITINPAANLTASAEQTFLLTARHGGKIAGTIQDPDMGLQGGVRVRVGEKRKEVIISNEGCYFFENAFA